jgi:Zn finger protein HypA/HybF involved in hydrogenase expression
MIDATDYYQKDKEPYGECPECGSQDISVYLLADYNSTIDSLNLEGDVSWNYSDALTDLYCNECGDEFLEAKEVKDGKRD